MPVVAVVFDKGLSLIQYMDQSEGMWYAESEVGRTEVIPGGGSSVLSSSG